MQPNRLFFGDCLEIMQEYIPDESVDLIYLDPPFNSKRIYNAFIGGAQWEAFKDTWQWYEAIDDFDRVAGLVETGHAMEGLRTMLGTGPDLAYLSYMANRLWECKRVLKQTGSIYLHCDPTMSHYLKLIMDAIFERRNFRNEIIWCYASGGYSSKHFGKKHDVILFFSKSNKYQFFPQFRPYSEGTLQRGLTAYKKQLNEKYELRKEGAYQNDWWTDIVPLLSPTQKERMGYPTQKPLALLKRIIQASSSEGDVVLDPFCGCGTTIHAAQDLKRRWIGIDVCVRACKVIQQRIENHFDSLWDTTEFVGMPKTLDDAKAMAEYHKGKFERWAASLTPGMEPNKKQVADGGIDGWGRLPIKKGVFVDVVAQVKGGGTGPSDVQAFNGARMQANADMGVFTCFEDKVTHAMKDAAVNAGRFQKWPVLQIYTVEDYFAERKPDLPLDA